MKKPLFNVSVDWWCWWNVCQVQQEVSKLNSIFTWTIYQPANILTGFRAALFFVFIYLFVSSIAAGFEDTSECAVWWHDTVYCATFVLNSNEQQQQIIIRVLCDIIFWKRLIQLDVSTCSHTVFRSWTQGLYFSQISMDWFLHCVNYQL